jgi:hypothetical protein
MTHRPSIIHVICKYHPRCHLQHLILTPSCIPQPPVFAHRHSLFTVSWNKNCHCFLFTTAYHQHPSSFLPSTTSSLHAVIYNIYIILTPSHIPVLCLLYLKKNCHFFLLTSHDCIILPSSMSFVSTVHAVIKDVSCLSLYPTPQLSLFCSLCLQIKTVIPARFPSVLSSLSSQQHQSIPIVICTYRRLCRLADTICINVMTLRAQKHKKWKKSSIL